MSEDLAESVRDVLEVDPEAFRSRAAADAEVVKEAIHEGTFDNHQSIVGLEYEFYAVADGRWSGESQGGKYALMRVPRRLLELIGFEKELGLHNAEMTTNPQPFNAHGLRAQEAEVRARLEAALNCTSAEGMRLVSDGMWTIPPVGETAREYLTDSVTDSGIRIATNMSRAVRYHAMANQTGDGRTVSVDAPLVDLSADTVMPESLITSIQPHYQVKQAVDLALVFNYALRVAGPLLALSVNTPVFPPDLYADGTSGDDVLADGWHENRIAVFESVLNDAADAEKVRFPRDLTDVEEAVDRVANDEPFVPMLPSSGDRFDDSFATLREKHGTYWRWVRPVFDGATRSEANARIEFRPIPAQPTVRDTTAVQAAFAGLMEALPRREHPIREQPWEKARENFYAAVRDGFEADMVWIDAAGESVTDTEQLFGDLLDHAEIGLHAAGCSERQAEEILRPLRFRVESGMTPAGWKREKIREWLESGRSLSAAIQGMQRAYIEHQADTLLDGSFEEWI